MRVVVITPPEPVVSLEEAKQHLKVEHGDDDLLIEAFIAAATGHVDGPTGWLGRAIGAQVLEARGALFCSGLIQLRYPPVIAIEELGYEDAAGEWQVLAPDLYELRGDCLGTAWGVSWPTTRFYRGDAETVRIRYQAGYEEVPAAIKVAVMLMVDDLYRNRGNVSDRTSSAIQMPTTSEMLLQPFRKYA